MAYLITKKIKGRRVKGKAKITRQWYLGSIRKLIELAEGASRAMQPREISCLEEGSIAALIQEARQIGVVDIVDSFVSKRSQGMTVGQYILLASLNRALEALPKTRIEDWLKSTAIHRYVDIQWDSSVPRTSGIISIVSGRIPYLLLEMP